MLRFSPSISETIAMMLVIPMMTPSTVRKERSLLVRIASNAISTPSRTSTAILGLRPERHDRVQLGRPRGRVDTEEEPDGGGHDHADQDRPGLDGGRKRRE